MTPIRFLLYKLFFSSHFHPLFYIVVEVLIPSVYRGWSGRLCSLIGILKTINEDNRKFVVKSGIKWLFINFKFLDLLKEYNYFGQTI